MQTAATHYEKHLGPIYSWMLGDIDAAFARAAAEIADLPLPASQGSAVDLGAGLGLHSLPLAKRGFDVTAIDTCEILIEELQSRCGSLRIRALQGDLLDFRALVTEQPQVILCMGDTLTHLPSLGAVEALLGSIGASVASNGVFAATFRDYHGRTLERDERFILVRADEDRILTCFLEYAEHHVVVHDLLNERVNGQWRQRISSYPKLRLPVEWVCSRLLGHGFRVLRDATPSGMVRIVATKAA
jgi:SAM-dependent methyltransferase